jgi:hypothetical protein
MNLANKEKKKVEEEQRKLRKDTKHHLPRFFVQEKEKDGKWIHISQKCTK